MFDMLLYMQFCGSLAQLSTRHGITLPYLYSLEELLARWLTGCAEMEQSTNYFGTLRRCKYVADILLLLLVSDDGERDTFTYLHRHNFLVYASPLHPTIHIQTYALHQHVAASAL